MSDGEDVIRCDPTHYRRVSAAEKNKNDTRDHHGDAVVVIIAVVVAENDQVCCRCFNRGECGSGRVMVGSRLLPVDTERTMSSSLSAGTCLCQPVCLFVVAM